MPSWMGLAAFVIVLVSVFGAAVLAWMEERARMRCATQRGIRER